MVLIVRNWSCSHHLLSEWWWWWWGWCWSCCIRYTCSAGVGRTGVFITLSIVLERMRYEGVVDIFQTVKILRTQRPAMVQNEVSPHGVSKTNYARFQCSCSRVEQFTGWLAFTGHFTGHFQAGPKTFFSELSARCACAARANLHGAIIALLLLFLCPPAQSRGREN